MLSGKDFVSRNLFGERFDKNVYRNGFDINYAKRGLSSSGKNLIGNITNNINSPISTNGVVNLLSNNNIRLKKSDNIQGNKTFFINYKNINNNLNKKINQRPSTSKKKRKN